MEHLYHHPLQGLGNILEQRVQRVQELEGGGGVVRYRCCTYFYTLVFGDSLCIPGCPRTRYVDLDGLELKRSPSLSRAIMPHQDLVQLQGSGRERSTVFSGEVTGKVPMLNIQEI